MISEIFTKYGDIHAVKCSESIFYVDIIYLDKEAITFQAKDKGSKSKARGKSKSKEGSPAKDGELTDAQLVI